MAGVDRFHVWRMTSQVGRECHWVCECGCGARKTTYDGKG